MRRRHAVLDSAAGLTPFGHAGWGYRDRGEFFSRAAEYIADGLRHHQYIAYAGERTGAALRAELAEMPGVGEHLDSGGIEVASTEDYSVYLPGSDVIDAGGSLDKYLAGVEQAVAAGYTGFLAVSDATPIACTAEQRDALARLEYLVDQQMAVLPFSALCAYDVSQLGAAAEELMCLHPYVSKGSTTFRLYADPAGDVDFALTGEIDAAATKLFATTLRRIWPIQSRHTLRIGAHALEFLMLAGPFLQQEHLLVARTARWCYQRIERRLFGWLCGLMPTMFSARFWAAQTETQ